jgi:hypothetical protein
MYYDSKRNIPDCLPENGCILKSPIKYFEYTPDRAYTVTQNAIFLTAFLKMDASQKIL